MPTLAEITQRPVSGLPHIDALIGSGQPWNYTGRDRINFSFAPAGGDFLGTLLDTTTLSGFSVDQQTHVRSMLGYVSDLTGIRFSEVAGTAADLHFGNANLHDGYSSQSYTRVSYTSQGDQVSDVTVESWVLLDAFDDAYDNAAPLPGGWGYESLLHELGHVLGLKHPFEGMEQLPAGDLFGQDNTGTTLMSWNDVGDYRSTYSPFDLAALEWLYGSDGLGGAFGVGSAGKSILGTAAADMLRGGTGTDHLTGGAGNDTLDGGAGLDMALYSAGRNSYALAKTASGFTVSGIDGADTLTGVERLKFADVYVALDVEGAAGQAYRLYQAAFNRVPDVPGLGFQMSALDNGWAVSQVAQTFIDSPEFASTYGALNTDQFVTQLYHNVLHRAPETSGFDYHVARIESGVARADILVGFSESPENQAAVIGTIQNGMVYTL